MNTSSSRNSSANIGTSGRLVAGDSDFTCRCCNTIMENSACWEFRQGDWLCTGCWTLIGPMDLQGEHRTRQAMAFMEQTITANRWQR